MDELVLAIERALENRNWHAALALSLTLPDICGKIDSPTAGSQKRYVDWFNKYVIDKYTSYLGREDEPTVFLSGNDCYALRCAYLHEGSADIAQQRARITLDSFVFTVQESGSKFHKNRVNSQLQIDVIVFCKDIISGIREWLKSNPVIPFAGMLNIQVVTPGMRIEF